MDHRWRDLERRLQASPGDQELLHRAIAARRRAGVPVPGWMLDERVFEGRNFDCPLALEVFVLLPSGRPVGIGRTPAGGSGLEVPPHRVMWVQPDDDEDFEALALVMRELRVEGLALDPGVSDARLAAVAEIPQLTRLDLSGCTRISGAGLEHVGRLSELSTLILWSCTKLDDAALEHLARLEALSTLVLTRCSKVTGKGLAPVGRLRDLRALSLQGLSKLSNRGLEHLAGLGRLTALDLRRCAKLSNGGLAHLAPLRELSVLNLSFCPLLTAEGLEEHLPKLPNLSQLYLLGCGIPEKDARAALGALSHLELVI